MLQKKYLVVVSLALALPSTILAVCYFIYNLIKKGIINEIFGLIIIVLVILNSFWLMIRYGRNLKNKP